MSETSPKSDESATMEIDDREQFSSLLTKLASLKVLTNDNLEEHEQILQALLNYINTDFESSIYSHLTNDALKLLVNYSDKTVRVPCLIKTDYPRALLKWLSSISK